LACRASLVEPACTEFVCIVVVPTLLFRSRVVREATRS